MTERKFKKLMADKPYLMDDMFQRSKSEARRMALASELTIEEVIQAARQRSDMPEQAWERVDRALNGKRRVGRACRTRSRVQPRIVRRRLVAIAAALLLIAAFFSLIPSGRTLARGAFDYFMNIFDNQIKIGPSGQLTKYPTRAAESNPGVGEAVNDYGDVVVEYDDFAAFTADLGLMPVWLDSDRFDCVGITLTKYESSGVSLSSRYTSGDGDIVITQKWLVSDDMGVYSGGDAWSSTQILGDTDLQYTVDPSDGMFDGFAILRDSIVWIAAQPSVDMLGELPNLTR
ncbi:MAG: hypothetical protein GX417_07530 [Clostridiales bacterium]|nr:hypothetical protein [Clostridiales bacterium]